MFSKADKIAFAISYSLLSIINFPTYWNLKKNCLEIDKTILRFRKWIYFINLPVLINYSIQLGIDIYYNEIPIQMKLFHIGLIFGYIFTCILGFLASQNAPMLVYYINEIFRIDAEFSGKILIETKILNLN